MGRFLFPVVFSLLLTFSTAHGEGKKRKPGTAVPAPAPTRVKTVDENSEEIDPSTIKLVEFFSVDKTPGKGVLDYIQGSTTETIKLGAESGHYGLGMIFPSDNLPEPYNKDFSHSDILQLAFGTLKSHLQLQIPQFGAATLISAGPLRTKTTFKLTVPSGKERDLRNVALLLFTSPAMPNEQGDEEKLKGTFFAQGGTLIVTPAGKTQSMVIKSGGKKFNFSVRNMLFEFKVKLATPFNAQENELKGTVEFPVFWPTGKGARSLARRIASESLAGMGPVPVPEGLTSHPRDVAGSTKKNRSAPPAPKKQPAPERSAPPPSQLEASEPEY